MPSVITTGVRILGSAPAADWRSLALAPPESAPGSNSLKSSRSPPPPRPRSCTRFSSGRSLSPAQDCPLSAARPSRSALPLARPPDRNQFEGESDRNRSRRWGRCSSRGPTRSGGRGGRAGSGEPETARAPLGRTEQRSPRPCPSAGPAGRGRGRKEAAPSGQPGAPGRRWEGSCFSAAKAFLRSLTVDRAAVSCLPSTPHKRDSPEVLRC